MIEYTSPASLIPVLVTGIRQQHVRAADGLSCTGSKAPSNTAKLFSDLPTQAGWIPVTSTGMRALVAGAPTVISKTECLTR